MINHSVSGKNKEDHIHQVLTDGGFHVQREVTCVSPLFRQKLKQRKIDMKINYGKMVVYLESDGKVHGTLETPTQSTLKRNADFELGNLPYIIINHESIIELRKIMNLGHITTEKLTEFIVTYRMWEEYSKHLAKIEAGEIV